MSHVKNMQAFGKLTGICTGLGGTYNPGQQNLQVNVMATLMNIAQQSWEEVKEAQSTYDKATNNRELGFRKIRKLSARVYDMLKASGANTLLLDDALNCKRRIYGARISKLPVADLSHFPMCMAADLSAILRIRIIICPITSSTTERVLLYGALNTAIPLRVASFKSI